MPGSSDFLMRCVVIVGSLPFQLCEHGVVSFAQALSKAGASSGLAQAFLLCAPATNITTIFAVLRSVGKNPWAAFRCVLGICLSALAISYFADWMELSIPIVSQEDLFHLPQWWLDSAKYTLAVMFVASVAGAIREKLSTAPKHKHE
jgi:uncharacterized membrane protein YraQ (UPF0718 family)